MPNDIPEPQAVTTPINRSAIFIVATLVDGEEHADTARAWCADVAALVRSVGKRVPSGNLSCVVGFGSGAWDKLFGAPRPAQLHRFVSSARVSAARSPRRATSCCISVPIRWTCASSLRRSW